MSIFGAGSGGGGGWELEGGVHAGERGSVSRRGQEAGWVYVVRIEVKSCVVLRLLVLAR